MNPLQNEAPTAENSSRGFEEILDSINKKLRKFSYTRLNAWCDVKSSDSSELEKAITQRMLITDLASLVSDLDAHLNELQTQHLPQLQSGSLAALAEARGLDLNVPASEFLNSL